MPGGSSGHTSRTAQGAWSTTNRVAWPRLCGPQTRPIAVAGRHEQVGYLGDRGG